MLLDPPQNARRYPYAMEQYGRWCRPTVVIYERSPWMLAELMMFKASGQASDGLATVQLELPAADDEGTWIDCGYVQIVDNDGYISSVVIHLNTNFEAELLLEYANDRIGIEHELDELAKVIIFYLPGVTASVLKIETLFSLSGSFGQHRAALGPNASKFSWFQGGGPG